MAINSIKTLVQKPYFDDFKKEKGFYKILFKEGVGIQTRELNQLQSILQEQIHRLGSYIFKDGSIVYGCNNRLSTSSYSLELDSSYTPLDVSFFEHLKGCFLRNSTSTTTIKVLFVEFVFKEGENTPRPMLVYNLVSGDHPLEDEVFFKLNNKTDTLTTLSVKFVGERYTASYIHIEEGVIFAMGYFLFVTSHRVLISPFTGSPSCSIGFSIDTEIVSATEDENLTDNAYISDYEGYHNTIQFGADRLKYNTLLEIRPLFTDTVFAEVVKVDNFFEFMRVESGTITKQVINPSYDEVEKTMA